MSGALFPAGEALGQASVLAVYACGADLLVDAHATAIRCRDATETLEVDVVAGGKKRTLQGRTVTLATGYGRRRLDLEDAESRFRRPANR